MEAIVPPHGKNSIDLHFWIIPPSFPMVHKNVFRETYDLSHRLCWLISTFLVLTFVKQSCIGQAAKI